MENLEYKCGREKNKQRERVWFPKSCLQVVYIACVHTHTYNICVHIWEIVTVYDLTSLVAVSSPSCLTLKMLNRNWLMHGWKTASKF